MKDEWEGAGDMKGSQSGAKMYKDGDRGQKEKGRMKWDDAMIICGD